MAKVTIATDGSGTSKGPGGWAAVLRCGDQMKEISGGVKEATNNTMEMTAVIMALRQLSRPCFIELTTDSEYVLKGATERLPKWKMFGWKTFDGSPVKNRDLWEQLDHEMSRHEITWLWTAGHSGHTDNERCDELAGAERRKLKGEPEPKKRKKKVFNLANIDDDAIRDALAALPADRLERLRGLVLA